MVGKVVVEVQQAWWEVVLTLLVAAGTIGAAVYAARAANAANAAVQLERERRDEEWAAGLVADVHCSELSDTTPDSISPSGARTRYYFRITNNGPHEARTVDIEFDGQPPLHLDDILNGDLAAGQHLDLDFTHLPGVRISPCFVTWTDGRDVQQRRSVPLARWQREG